MWLVAVTALLSQCSYPLFLAVWLVALTGHRLRAGEERGNKHGLPSLCGKSHPKFQVLKIESSENYKPHSEEGRGMNM